MGNMDDLKRTVILVVVVTGLAFIGITDSFKTDDQIMTEIISMADAITIQCPSDKVVNYCSMYRRQLDTAVTVQQTCVSMDYFCKCKSNVCKNQSKALKQLLSDAMIIPYCTTMATFPRVPSYWNVAERLSDMAGLCQFLPELDCDLPLRYVLLSQNMNILCIYERYYLLCLEQRCVNPSTELLRKIVESKDDSLCYDYDLPLSYPVTIQTPNKSRIPVSTSKTTVTTRSYRRSTAHGQTTTPGSCSLPQVSVVTILMTSLLANYL